MTADPARSASTSAEAAGGGVGGRRQRGGAEARRRRLLGPLQDAQARPRSLGPATNLATLVEGKVGG